LVVLKPALPIVTVHSGDLNSRESILTELLHLARVKTFDESKEYTLSSRGGFLILTKVADYSSISTDVELTIDLIQPL
jgi:hypothetical protein